VLKTPHREHQSGSRVEDRINSVQKVTRDADQHGTAVVHLADDSYAIDWHCKERPRQISIKPSSLFVVLNVTDHFHEPAHQPIGYPARMCEAIKYYQ